MIRILHLTISSDIGGGPEHIFQLINGLNDKFENFVACPTDGAYYEKFLKLTSGRVTELPFRKFKLTYLFSLYNYIKQNRINVMHAHGKGAGLYCRLISLFVTIAVVHTPHGISEKLEKGWINSLYILFEKTFSKLINTVIYVSESECLYAKKISLWNRVSSSVIHNGTKVFSEGKRKSMRALNRRNFGVDGERVIITASRFDYQKNSEEFCKIAGMLPEYRFVIIGDGLERANCEKFCAVHDIYNVSFIGKTLDPLNYLSSSDLYLSTSRWEGLSMAILEAMSMGLPIVATDVVGNIDLVEHDANGFLYPLNDVNEAKKRIQKIFENYDHYSSQSVKKHLSNFSSIIMCERTARIYYDLNVD